MKELWKKFCKKCTEAWKNVRASIKALIVDFWQNAKGVIKNVFALCKDFIIDCIKALIFIITFISVILMAFGVYLYDVIILFLEWLIGLLNKSGK